MTVAESWVHRACSQRRQRDGLRCAPPQPRGIRQRDRGSPGDSTGSSGTRHPLRAAERCPEHRPRADEGHGVQDLLVPVQLQTRLDRFQRSEMEQDPRARAKENEEQAGQRDGGKPLPSNMPSSPARPSRTGTSPPQGAPRSPPSPSCASRNPPPPETVTDFTRLSNGITEISSQLSPDAPAVKTNPNYKRLIVPFLCHRHY